MRHALHCPATLLLAALAATPGRAQSCEDLIAAEGPAVARRYAPVLFFAPGERYFPTLPVYTAYRSGGLSDPARLAPLDDGRASWDSLNVRYLHEVEGVGSGWKVRAPAPAVFYESRCLSGHERHLLFAFLKNDPQAFHRLGVDTLFANGLNDASYVAVTYYLYYLRDGGLEGHAHDVERIVIFLPLTPDTTRPRVRQAAQVGVKRVETDRQGIVPPRVIVLVGTGHSSTTANNVLVVAADEALSLEHPSFLVERGGHSSAPDANRDAGFAPGMDINWNLSGAIWGTRDVQAVAGLAFLGSYKPWMTLPRTRGTFATLAPSEDDEAESEKSMDAVTDSLKKKGVIEEEGAPQRYSLLPMGPFARLDSLLAGFRARHCSPQDSVLPEVKSLLNGPIRRLLRREAGYRGLDATPPAAVPAVLCAYGRWAEPLQVRTASKAVARAPWVHPELNAPRTETLKRHLFRPTWEGLQDANGLVQLLYVTGSTRFGGGTQTAQLGIVVPVLPVLRLIAVPGVLELQVGPATTSFTHPARDSVRTRWGSFALLYDRQYKSTISWYTGIDRVHGRRFVMDDPRAGDVAFVGGVSVMPFFFMPDLISPLATRVRFRFGVQLWQRHAALSLGGFEFRSMLYLR